MNCKFSNLREKIEIFQRNAIGEGFLIRSKEIYFQPLTQFQHNF